MVTFSKNNVAPSGERPDWRLHDLGKIVMSVRIRDFQLGTARRFDRVRYGPTCVCIPTRAASNLSTYYSKVRWPTFQQAASGPEIPGRRSWSSGSLAKFICEQLRNVAKAQTEASAFGSIRSNGRSINRRLDVFLLCRHRVTYRSFYRIRQHRRLVRFEPDRALPGVVCQ